jgi:hypothetical protein
MEEPQSGQRSTTRHPQFVKKLYLVVRPVRRATLSHQTCHDLFYAMKAGYEGHARCLP